MDVEYLTVNQFSDKYPWPTKGGLRALILDAKWGKNKFAPAFIRVGRRVLINEKIFWDLVKQQQQQ